MGASLVVALNTDASVRRVKGEGRPIIGEAQRRRILAALEAVDFVMAFESDKLADILALARQYHGLLFRACQQTNCQVQLQQPGSQRSPATSLSAIAAAQGLDGLVESIFSVIGFAGHGCTVGT